MLNEYSAKMIYGSYKDIVVANYGNGCGILQQQFDKRGAEDFVFVLQHRLKEQGLDHLLQGPILDLGCGIGADAAAFGRKFPDSKIIGIDHDEDSLKIAKMISGKNVEYLNGSIQRLPFQDNYFSLINTKCVLIMYEGISIPVIDEVIRTLKPGGVFCASEDERSYAPFIRAGLVLQNKDKRSLDAALLVKQ